MALMIVSREDAAMYEHLRDAFGGGTGIDVVFDRRYGERRREAVDAGALEQRRAERRRSYVDQQLRSVGWAIVGRP